MAHPSGGERAAVPATGAEGDAGLAPLVPPVRGGGRPHGGGTRLRGVDASVGAAWEREDGSGNVEAFPAMSTGARREVTASPRRRHLVALLLAALVGVLSFLLPGVAAAGRGSISAPVGECPPVTLEPCPPVETTEPTTTSSETTSTTLVETTTTAPPQQTTSTSTVRRTTTTERQVVASTTTTLNVTTSINLLVPGDGTEGSESTTTTLQTQTRISGGGTSDGTLIALIVGGLLALAVFVSVLTWRYWAATRPPLMSTVGSDHG